MSFWNASLTKSLNYCSLYKGLVPLWGRQIPCKLAYLHFYLSSLVIYDLLMYLDHNQYLFLFARVLYLFLYCLSLYSENQDKQLHFTRVPFLNLAIILKLKNLS